MTTARTCIAGTRTDQVATREGIDQGPFAGRDDAEIELTLYIRDKVTENERLMSD